ncbi:hypothetical protein EV702DRAFT_1228500 [Suillus placidus]|uniref:Uncharacterized protein n=1 Tax=Suillus placidus TaxID=48579 RepID=A0A9P6ZTY9_9AGAM|nr:hypothetical protein EV702DRAFT_1228500 [Suillus placidus]
MLPSSIRHYHHFLAGLYSSALALGEPNHASSLNGDAAGLWNQPDSSTAETLLPDRDLYMTLLYRFAGSGLLALCYSAYVHHKEVKVALGVKLVAPDLDKAVAGSWLIVVGPDNDGEALLDEIMSDLTSLLDSVYKSGHGVCVQASMCKIPVSGINIGPVHKEDVMRAATMLDKAKELAVILCFDVPVDKHTEQLAEEIGHQSVQRFQFPQLLH